MTESTSATMRMILRQLAIVHQNTVASAIGSDETHISKFASWERGLRIHQIGPALEVMKLKLVSADEVTLPADELNALQILARKSLGVTK